jgi:hypothetical protein
MTPFSLLVTCHFIPDGNDGLHENIAGKEANNSIRDSLGQLSQEQSKVAHYRRVISHFELAADWNLVAAASNNLVIQALPRERSLRDSESLETTSLLLE